jgi:hypothetical protein
MTKIETAHPMIKYRNMSGNPNSVTGLLKMLRKGKFIMIMPMMKKINHDSRNCSRCRILSRIRFIMA